MTTDPSTSAPTPRPRRRRRAAFGSARQLPSGRWQARYVDHDGTRRTAPRTFTTKTEAMDWVATNRADQVRGTWYSPDLGTQPLGTYAADWLAMRVDLAPRTRDHYARIIESWLTADLPHPLGPRRPPVNLSCVRVRDLSTFLVREWHAAATLEAHQRAQRRAEASTRYARRRAVHSARLWARQNGYTVGDSGRLSQEVLTAWAASGSPQAGHLELPLVTVPRDAGRTQVVHAYRLLRTICSTAVRDGLIVANPVSIAGAGIDHRTERTPATPAEVAQIAAAMPPHLSTAVTVAAWSGLRAGELFALGRRHIDLTAGTLRVERALLMLPGQPARFDRPKNHSSIRTVHLPRPVVDLLAEHLATFTGTGPEALVFTHNGKPVPSGIRGKHFRAACATVGRDDLRWHDLRHTGATMAAHAGASLRELQARLGHSTVDAAMRYQHATAERDRALAERLSALVVTPPTHGSGHLHVVGS